MRLRIGTFMDTSSGVEALAPPQSSVQTVEVPGCEVRRELKPASFKLVLPASRSKADVEPY